VDICTDNLLALYNTRLLKTYVELDPRTSLLMMLVVRWAKAQKILGATKCGYTSFMSSYAWKLMVVFYLQQQACPCGPLLPCLQQMPCRSTGTSECKCISHAKKEIDSSSTSNTCKCEAVFKCKQTKVSFCQDTEHAQKLLRDLQRQSQPRQLDEQQPGNANILPALFVGFFEFYGAGSDSETDLENIVVDVTKGTQTVKVHTLTSPLLSKLI
jgi:DNA polymerase sigma